LANGSQLTKSIYKLTMEFPGSEEFGLKSQMRRASVSICTNIAEGCGRRGDRDLRRANKLLSSIEKQRRLRRSSEAAANAAVRPPMTRPRADS
jgi:23S rRNA-intervening sequence protein